jgi:quinolinate synthase
VFYGPDSYMGGNLGTLLQQMATQSDEEVAKVHPQHTQASIRALLPRIHYFQVRNIHIPSVLWRRSLLMLAYIALT